MPTFKKGDLANAIAKNGEEIKLRIQEAKPNGSLLVQVYDKNNLPSVLSR
jgi:hypothetical protein